MAIIPFSKITPIKSIDDIEVDINGLAVKVKQYLPATEKAKLLTDVLDFVLDNQGITNALQQEVYGTLFIIRYYTNINITDAMIGNGAKTYDLIALNGIKDIIFNTIPKKELDSVLNSLDHMRIELHDFRQSLLGMVQYAADEQNITFQETNKLTGEFNSILSNPTFKDILATMAQNAMQQMPQAE